jgi:hypothetical protein
LPTDEFFTFKNCITRNNGLCISLNKFHYNAERYYFINKCVNVWNSLPNYVVNSACLNDFKRSLSVIDLSRFLKNRYDIGNFNNWNKILLYSLCNCRPQLLHLTISRGFLIMLFFIRSSIRPIHCVCVQFGRYYSPEYVSATTVWPLLPFARIPHDFIWMNTCIIMLCDKQNK